MTAVWQLVGREREQHLLNEVLARLSDGVGGMVLIAGEAGAGKTALVESVLSSTDVRIIRVAADRSGAVPYGPLRAALRDQLRCSPGREANNLAASDPSLALVRPERGGPGSAAGEEEIPLAIRRAFERLAQQRPTIVFLDDLQWADAATLELLGEWAPPLPGLPLLVIGAYRRDELPLRHPVRGLRAGLRRAAAGAQRHVELGPLSQAGSTLVRRVLGDLRHGFGVIGEIPLPDGPSLWAMWREPRR